MDVDLWLLPTAWISGIQLKIILMTLKATVWQRMFCKVWM